MVNMSQGESPPPAYASQTELQELYWVSAAWLIKHGQYEQSVFTDADQAKIEQEAGPVSVVDDSPEELLDWCGPHPVFKEDTDRYVSRFGGREMARELPAVHAVLRLGVAGISAAFSLPGFMKDEGDSQGEYMPPEIAFTLSKYSETGSEVETIVLSSCPDEQPWFVVRNVVNQSCDNRGSGDPKKDFRCPSDLFREPDISSQSLDLVECEALITVMSNATKVLTAERD